MIDQVARFLIRSTLLRNSRKTRITPSDLLSRLVGLALIKLIDEISRQQRQEAKLHFSHPRDGIPIPPMQQLHNTISTPPSRFLHERVNEMKAFATNKMRGRYTVYERLSKMIAPYVCGAEDVKMAICYALASQPDYPVHVLLIGEPATVKTDLLSEVQEICSQDTVFGGPRSTVAGLTIDAAKNSPGLFVLADQKILLIDELDKFGRSELNQLYEALDSGRITVNISGRNEQIPTHFVCISSANPNGQILPRDPKLVRGQIEKTIPPALMSRFHLVFLLTEERGERLDRAISTILTRKNKQNQMSSFLKDYFSYIKKECKHVEYNFDRNDRVIKKAAYLVKKAIEMSRNEKLQVAATKRLAESIRRISISGARMRLSNSVEDVDIENALTILKSALGTCGLRR